MDLYMAGSTFKELNEWLQQKGYNKLMSQLNDRKCIAEWVDYKRTHKDCKSKVFIDSGAFTAHTKGAEVDVDEYIEYMNKNDDALTVFAQVDKIPGTFGVPYTYEQIAEAPEKSWENYLYMAPKLKSKEKLIPIFHQGEDHKWLKNMLEYTDENGEHIAYIGLSTRNDASVAEKDEWLKICFSMIKESSNPNVKTHAFGMTSFRLLEKYPFTSADSTSWIQTAVNGSIFSKYGVITLSEKSKHNKGHFDYLDKDVQKTLLEYIESKGFTYDELATDYKKRELFNIMYMNDWADNYECKSTSFKVNNLFNLVKG